MRHVAEAQIETRRLDVIRVDSGRGANASRCNQLADFLRREYAGCPGVSVFGGRFQPVFKSNLALVGCGHL
jgi:hypothetical protein